MELITRVSGTLKLNNVMVEVIKYGVMEAYTKDIGRVIKQMVVVDSSMQTVTFMMVTGKMIKLMGSASTLTLMALSMRAIGLTISNMAKARSTGQMARNMKANISMERKMVMVSSCGLIDLVTVESLSTIIFMEKAPIHGLTAEFTMETGSKIRCTEKEFSRGPMVASMKVNTLMTKSKVMVFFTGQMVDSMMDTGCLENKKASVSTSTLRVKLDMEDGRTVNVSNGYLKKSITWKFSNSRSKEINIDSTYFKQPFFSILIIKFQLKISC